MDPRLKQRLVGAAVLVALAVIFLPLLVQGPAPDSGAASVPLAIPPAPRDDFQTQELPLVTPGDAPAGGALGMDAPVGSAPEVAPPSPDAAELATPAAAGAADGTDTGAAAPAPAPPVAPAAATPDAAPLYAATAGGDYAVSFGAYASVAAAERVLGSVRGAGLPAYREATTSGGKPAWRVRIGPFATRAEAESARLRASHVRDDVGARVVVLDADAARPAPSGPEQKPAAAPKQAATVAPKPAAASVGFAVQLAAYSKASDATALRDRLRAAGFSAFTETVRTDKGALVRVRVGPVADRAAAEQLRAQVKAKLGVDGMVRPHP